MTTKNPPRAGLPSILILVSFVLLGFAVAPGAGATSAQTVAVSSDGTAVYVDVEPGVYEITASGTWHWTTDRSGTVVADASSTYGDGTNPGCHDWPGDNHDLLVDGLSPWTSTCNPSHTYSTTYTCDAPGGCSIELRVLDDLYSDNEGALTVVVSLACPPLAPDVVLCLKTGAKVLTAAVAGIDASGGPAHRVAGHVDLYRFALPPGGFATLACVELTVDAATLNPCAAAGGTFVSRVATLVDESPAEPQLAAPIATVSVCEATLTATVLGVGVSSFPTYAPC